MSSLLILLSFFALSFLAGYFLISRVPSLLHTPLMSMTNAISAVTILGAILLFSAPTDALQNVLGVLALSLAAFNVVGGFAITGRILKLFKKSQ